MTTVNDGQTSAGLSRSTDTDWILAFIPRSGAMLAIDLQSFALLRHGRS